MHILLSLLRSFCDTYFPKIKMQAPMLPAYNLRSEAGESEVGGQPGLHIKPPPQKRGEERKENPNQINKQLSPLKNKIKTKKSGNRRGEKTTRGNRLAASIGSVL